MTLCSLFCLFSLTGVLLAAGERFNSTYKVERKNYASRQFKYNAVSEFLSTENLFDSLTPWIQGGQLCDLIPYDILKCSSNHGISILGSHCVTYNEVEA